MELVAVAVVVELAAVAVVAVAAVLLILGTCWWCWWYFRIDEESNSGSGLTYPDGEGGKALPLTRIDEDSNLWFTCRETDLPLVTKKLSDSNPKGLVTKNLHSNLVSEGGKPPPPTRTDEDSNPEGWVTYPVTDLIAATKNFSDSNLIGKGGSARVYRADLGGNRIAAIKKLRRDDSTPTLFSDELSILLRVPHHPNLVNLLGISSDTDNQMIVFEYVPNGTLFTRLHEYQGDAGPLSWASRKQIARQVAEALEHLHGKPNPRIIHRDVKSKNVLLVDDSNAKLADFGLAKLCPKNNGSTSTIHRCGTPGYADPQYWNGGKCSPKSDVYSFGVLLLELITGKKAVNRDENLVNCTREDRLSGDTNDMIKIVDQSLTNGNNRNELWEMIRIANRCLEEKREKRLTMTEVVNMMDEIRNEFV